MSSPLGFLVRLPLETKSPNRSFVMTMGGRMAQAKRARDHKSVALMAVSANLRSRRLSVAELLPVLVTLTRVSAGTLDDDNLAASMKALRDGVAKALGIDDGDRARLRFAYRQRKGPRGHHEVEVLVESARRVEA